jgi:hypothetical protein
MNRTATNPGLDKIWANDRLNRSQDAAFLKSFLLNRIAERKKAGLPASYVLNIDAQWGQGKSFFLDRFAQTLKLDSLLVAEVNAWQDDHADDPLLSVMDAIDVAVAPLVKRERKMHELWSATKHAGGAIAVAATRGAAVQLAKKVLGPAVEEIEEILKTGTPTGAGNISEELAKTLGDAIGERGKELLESFREGKRTIASFRDNLRRFLITADARAQKLPLFVLVDELDRCRPSFAIAMLERIKHLFDIDQVVFVIATDTTQLSHAVGAVYGSGFNSEGYLSRFFNRSYHFEPTSKKQFLEGLFAQFPLDDEKISLPPRIGIPEYLTGGFDYFALSLRDIEQIHEILRSVVTAWSGHVKIELAALFPIVVAYQQKMPLPLDGDAVAKLQQLALKLGGGKAEWNISFVNESRQPHFIAGVSLANDYYSHSSQPLSKLNHGVTAPHSRWVVQALSDERTQRGGRYSVIQNYPGMVSSAGRLVPSNKS